MHYKTIFLETLRGKSLVRTLQNIELFNIEVSGDGIDLGAKSKNSSYYRFLKIKPGTNLIFSDISSTNDGILKIDLEKTFPLQDLSKDFLILSNVLEHLFHYDVCIKECLRVLKKNGRLIGIVPFMYPIHLDPDDHFRYTYSTLERLFVDAGFSHVLIKSIGFGPVTAGFAHIAKIVKLKPLVALLYILSILTDKLLNVLFRNNEAVKAENFPLSYFFICTK